MMNFILICMFVIKEVAVGLWKTSNYFPIRYFLSTLAAVAAAQLLFGIDLFILVATTLIAYAVFFGMTPAFLKEIVLPTAGIVLVIATGIQLFLPLAFFSPIALPIACLAIPLIWNILTSGLIKNISKNVSVSLDEGRLAVDELAHPVDMLIGILTILHVGIIIAYVVQVLLTLYYTL